MQKTSMDAFLEERDGSEPAPEPEADQAAPEAAPEPEAAPAPDEGEEPDAGPTIPRSAFVKAREDWKAKAVEARAQAQERADQLEAMRRELEELKKPKPSPGPAPQQYQPPPQPQLPDPETNPAGYLSALMEHQRREAEERVVHERFNHSELRLRDRIGDEAVDALIGRFQQELAADPTLGVQVRQQRDPFAWVHKQLELKRLQTEIGADPAAYEAKLRERIMAEMQAAAPPQPAAQAPGPPLPRQGPSLATARTSAGRATSDFTGPPSLEDVFRK